MTPHDAITEPAPDCALTVPGGSGPRRIQETTEELLSAALRDLGRARGVSTGWGVRVLSECVGFDVRRAYQSYIRVGDWTYQGLVSATYATTVESMTWVTLRLREWQHGSDLPPLVPR